MTSFATKLAQLARDYCRAEETVVSAFFDRKHSHKESIRWLRAQAFKEYSAIKPILSALAKLYPDIDSVIDRHDFEELTEKLADETKHARLVMDLLEELGGRKVTSADLLWLPEDRKLAAIRARYSRSYATLLHGLGSIDAGEIKRTDEQIERAAITLTEGGGGALYNVCRQLKKNGFDRKIASVFQQIFADELNHKGSGERSLTKIIRTKREFLRAAHIISDISLQRLRMRNEQFGFPLSDHAICACDASIRRSFSLPRARSPAGRKPRGGRR